MSNLMSTLRWINEILRVVRFPCCDSFLMASRRKEFFYDKYEANDKSQRSAPKNEGTLDQDFPPEEKPPSLPGSPKKCFGETQIEIFHHRHGLLVLHLVATLMFAPSLVAWLQVWIAHSSFLLCFLI